MSPMRSPFWIWVVLMAVGMYSPPASAIDMCRGGNRAARKVTCLIDSDSLWKNGVKMRLLDIDGPETFEAECPAEKAIGGKATRRMQELMSGGYRIVDSGQKDRTSDRRALVRVILPDGRDAGQLLVDEGLAQLWPNRGNKWCNR